MVHYFGPPQNFRNGHEKCRCYTRFSLVVIYSHFRMTSRPRTTSFVDSQKGSNANNFGGMKISSKDGSKVMTVIASPGQGPDRSTEVSYTDTKV